MVAQVGSVGEALPLFKVGIPGISVHQVVDVVIVVVVVVVIVVVVEVR